MNFADKNKKEIDEHIEEKEKVNKYFDATLDGGRVNLVIGIDEKDLDEPLKCTKGEFIAIFMELLNDLYINVLKGEMDSRKVFFRNQYDSMISGFINTVITAATWAPKELEEMRGNLKWEDLKEKIDVSEYPHHIKEWFAPLKRFYLRDDEIEWEP